LSKRKSSPSNKVYDFDLYNRPEKYFRAISMDIYEDWEYSYGSDAESFILDEFGNNIEPQFSICPLVSGDCYGSSIATFYIRFFKI